MKRIGSEIGNLSSKFLAYTQMKRIEIVRPGEIAPVLGISASQELDLLRRLARSGWILRLQRGIYLVPPRIPPGGNYSPGIPLILDKLIGELKGRYQIGGPTAFNYYGFDGQVPNVTYVYNNRISGSRRIGKLAFQFIKIADDRLGSTENVVGPDEVTVIYASKARTIVDAIYDWSRFNSLPQAYGWIKEELIDFPKFPKELVETAIQYGNQATMRRIGYCLDKLMIDASMLDLLQSKLSNSKSLIPWIPEQHAKGSANRKWGIIVNG